MKAIPERLEEFVSDWNRNRCKKEKDGLAAAFGKTEGITFEAGIFTNCTQDHLDFFADMNEYSGCKKKLFRGGRCLRSVINSDDATGREIARFAPAPVTYGLKNPADVFAVDIAELPECD